MLVSFCIVAYNEEKSINSILQNIINQTFCHKNMEILLIDSNSTDRTKEYFSRFKEKYEFQFNKIVVLGNPRKTLPCGWNIALANYCGEVIIRVDAHAILPKDFIEKNVENILKGYDICGGLVLNYSRCNSKWSRIVNASENSMIGGSIASFRRETRERNVNTLAFAMYKKDVFVKVGKYNEILARTEDNDMHYRMKKAGYKMHYCPEIVSYRETRTSYRKLIRQKYLNGYWIGLTIGVNSKCFSIYHFVPFLFVLSIILSIIFLTGKLFYIPLYYFEIYFLFVSLMSILSIIKEKIYYFRALLLPLMLIILHICYGIGTLSGIIYMPFWIKKIKS